MKTEEYSNYELTYPYWMARLATGITLAVVDLRQRHEHLARLHLEALMRESCGRPCRRRS